MVCQLNGVAQAKKMATRSANKPQSSNNKSLACQRIQLFFSPDEKRDVSTSRRTSSRSAPCVRCSETNTSYRYFMLSNANRERSQTDATSVTDTETNCPKKNYMALDTIFGGLVNIKQVRNPPSGLMNCHRTLIGLPYGYKPGKDRVRRVRR